MRIWLNLKENRRQKQNYKVSYEAHGAHHLKTLLSPCNAFPIAESMPT